MSQWLTASCGSVPATCGRHKHEIILLYTRYTSLKLF